MRGILFKPDMIKAIREGRKTQTRRVLKPQPIESVIEIKEHSEVKGYWIPYSSDRRMVNNNQGYRKNDCGYKTRFQVGEVVYIQEAWESDCTCGNLKCNGVIYKLGYSGKIIPDKWRSPLFMPAWAARTHLKITGVGYERLQEITEADAEAEGVDPNNPWGFYDGYINSFTWLWDSINPKQKWDTNPWVVKNSFRLEKETESGLLS